MKRTYSRAYLALREYLDEVKVIETHEHFIGGTATRPCGLIDLVMSGYASCDLRSASPELERVIEERAMNEALSDEERVNAYFQAHPHMRHGAYHRGIMRGLRECYGIEALDERGLAILKEKAAERSDTFYTELLKKYGIAAKIVDPSDPEVIYDFATKGGNWDYYSADCRMVFPLPWYHSYDQEKMIPLLEKQAGRQIATLDEYISAFDDVLDLSLAAGLVGLKDQSAYRRVIAYPEVPKREAEAAFDALRQGQSLSREQYLTLSNYLMRHFLDLARAHSLPVQLHTGHMSGVYNDIRKANAIHLTETLQEYGDVQFDLFHGSWPYMDEYLFLGKNYPNVTLDLCWVQTIDPLYAIELMKRAVMTVPTNKLMAFGGDDSTIEHIIGYLCIARDNIATALSELIDSRWLSLSDAKEIAACWLYRNPNQLYRLDLPSF